MKSALRVFALLISVLIFVNTESLAQAKTHKLLIDLNSADTTDQAAVLRQIRNLWRELPDTKVEVLIHGQAISAIKKIDFAIYFTN